MKPASICVCENDSLATMVGEGKDFEYHTSDETFSAVQCNTCGLIYLNPRPAVFDFEKIYPPTYRAYDFSAKNFGLTYKIRSHFERRRLLHHCRHLPGNARILDVGCGAPFELLHHSFQIIIK